jgi:hypothetical protein
LASIFDGDDFKLADLGFLGDEAELRARARQELLAAGGDTASRARQEGTDDTGAVLVAVDRDGRVEAVEVSRNWQDRLTPGDFAAALFAAWNAAQVKHINAAALERFALEEEGDNSTGRSTVDDGSRMPRDSADEQAWLAEIWSVLSNNDDQLHRIERGERLVAQASREVSGPHGFLTAQIEGAGSAGIIAGIRGDAELIRSAGAPQLEVEALAVFRAAREEAANGR